MGGAITKVRNMSTSKASQPPAAPADPAQEKAATKIQARSRGKTGRAQTEAIKDVAPVGLTGCGSQLYDIV